MPKISFILPVYNVERYLPRAADSLRAQTLTDFEAIFVDDGSPDGSGALLDSLASSEPRFRVIHQANGGVARARNAALNAATGDYLFFLDPDDWIEPDAAQTVYNAAQAADADIVQFGLFVDVCDGKGQVVSTSEALPSFEGILRGHPFQEKFDELATSYFITTKLMKRAFLESYHGRFPNKNIGEDGLFYVDFYAHDPACLVSLRRALYHYTLSRSESLSNSYHPERMKDNFYLSRAVREAVAAWGLLQSPMHLRTVRYCTVRDLQLSIKNASLSPLDNAKRVQWLKNVMQDADVRDAVQNTPLAMAHSRNDKVKLLLLKLHLYRLTMLLSSMNRS